jgi:hypothetical protein
VLVWAGWPSATAWAGPPDSTPAIDESPSPRRPVPDYSGRGSEPTTAGEVALWVPRVILSPVYLVTEFVLRRPLGALVTALDRGNWPAKAYNFFAFGPDHKAGIVPVGFVEFDFNPSVGLYAFWNDAGFKGNSLHAHGEIWPTEWYAGKVVEHARIDDTHTLEWRIEGIHRPDKVFYGIGPRTLNAYQSRYTLDRFDVGGWFDWRFWRASHVRIGGGVRTDHTSPGHFGDDPSLPQEAATGSFAIPYGFERTDSVVFGRAVLGIDSRKKWPPEGSGLRIDMVAEPATDVRAPGSGWVKYGGTAGAYLDLNRHGRVISFAVSAMFEDSLSPSHPIPFTELTSLGGDPPMRGFFEGRLLDRSSATAALKYLWPIGPWLDGTLQAVVGNVFDGHLDGFRPGLLRFSGAVGLSAGSVSEYPLELVLGCGSETFEQGARIDSFRFTLSANHGF